MKKTFRYGLILAALAASGLASAQVASSVADGRISVQSASYAAANGIGASLSHAETSATSYSYGVQTLAPGSGVVNAAIGGSVNAMAYNTVLGSGVGSASAGGWSDASYNLAGSLPGISGSLSLDGGMGNAVLNGTDAHVIASTAQDGFATGSYAATGYVGGTYNAGGVTGVFGGSTQDTTANAGAVTFTGGAPAGQSAAVRYANSGVQASTTAAFANASGL